MSFIDALIADLISDNPEAPVHVTVGSGSVGYHLCIQPFRVKSGLLAGPVIPPPDPISPAPLTPVPGDAKVVPISEQVAATPTPMPEATSLWSVEVVNDTPPAPVMGETTSGAPLVSG